MSDIRTLSAREAAQYYDSFGSKQDSQEFYEGPPLKDLLAHLDMPDVRSILEFGCGTGKFAEQLLQSDFAKEATYTGLDVSQTMVELAASRLARFGARVTTRKTEGSCKLDLPRQSFDLIIANYVFDLLSDEDAKVLLSSFFDLLKPEGKLGLVSLTQGEKGLATLTAKLWQGVHKISPKLVGGCRPIELTGLLGPDRWVVQHRRVLAPFAIPSEIIVAVKRQDNLPDA